MAHHVDPVPSGFHSVNPILTVRGADRAIEFYRRAFGAEVTERMDRPDGKVMHATLKIGDSTLMLGEECEPHEGHEEECVRSPADLKGTTVTLYLYADRADAVFDRAVEAGGEGMMPMTDMFWGDRIGMIRDPFGHVWGIASHIEDLSPEEMESRMQQQMQR